MTMNPSCSPRSSVSDSLCQMQLEEHYNILSKLGSGTYGKVLLASCKRTGTDVALKVLPKKSIKQKDFIREFNYSYYLSPHRSILNTFDVAFETTNSYVFAQEHAPCGDLFEAITPQVGLPESHVKLMAKQIASALDFMHSKSLVHRDIKPENILLFDDQFNLVKLMDFGMTKKSKTLVRKVSAGIPYTPPEICEALKGERYSVETSADVWGFGVLLFCSLTGNFPWELAHHTDTFYSEFSQWQKRKTTRVPSQWKRFTARLMRFFRRMLEIKQEKRCAINETFKYIDDTWINTPKSLATNSQETDESNPLNELSDLLEGHGIDSKVNKEKRINDWLVNST